MVARVECYLRSSTPESWSRQADPSSSVVLADHGLATGQDPALLSPELEIASIEARLTDIHTFPLPAIDHAGLIRNSLLLAESMDLEVGLADTITVPEPALVSASHPPPPPLGGTARLETTAEPRLEPGQLRLVASASDTRHRRRQRPLHLGVADMTISEDLRRELLSDRQRWQGRGPHSTRQVHPSGPLSPTPAPAHPTRRRTATGRRKLNIPYGKAGWLPRPEGVPGSPQPVTTMKIRRKGNRVFPSKRGG